MGIKKITSDFKLKEDMFFIPTGRFYINGVYQPTKYILYGTPVRDIRRRARIVNKSYPFGSKHGWRIKKVHI